MKKLLKSLMVAFAAVIIFCCGWTSSAGQAQPAKAEAPILLTSCGQSMGTAQLKVLLQQKLKLLFDVDPLATSAALQAKAKSGTPYKSMIIVMGASLKGMGAAGISIDDELKRAAELIAEARKEGITIIGAHIGGMKNRAQGAAAGDTTDEQSIDAVGPNANILLVYKEGNADGRFTTISKARNIPLLEADRLLDLVPALEKIYGK
jgi:hypothetical protein